MKNKEKTKSLIVTFVVLLILGYMTISMLSDTKPKNNNTINHRSSNDTFYILASQENKTAQNIIEKYANDKGYKVEFEYQGTLEIMNTLNTKASEYDAVWLSNSIWGYMLNNSVSLANSKCTSINPVIFGIKKSKAEELGFVGKEIYTKDILSAISNKKLKFSMSNPTTTNSGASAYLGLVSTLAGNPEVLTSEMLNEEKLRQEIKTLFTGLERSSGSEDFLEELFLNGDYEAVVAYESSIININKQLVTKGKEPLYAIYPVDGVSISDAPFAYINNKNENKKEVFDTLQKYILSDEGQKLLQEQGKRTWYGGTNSNVNKTVFNPEWGIDTTKYISPVKYPSAEVIKEALKLYQTELRKPVHVAFCLDYSGSMAGEGIEELKDAMNYILTEKAASDFIQFSYKDKIDIIPFASNVRTVWSTTNGSETSNILANINNERPTGTTALYPAAIKALEALKDEDKNTYNTSIILMTDGLANVGSYADLSNYYKILNTKIPIYSIMFGGADRSQLQPIANLTNAKVFDGKTNLVEAFKEVRGYN